MIEMEIFGSKRNLDTDARILYLRERGGDRQLLIKVSPYDIDLLGAKLFNTSFSRFLIHDFINSVIKESGAKILYSVITEIKGGIFYSVLVLVDSEDNKIEMDCKSSDAVLLCVNKAPIYSTEALLGMLSWDLNPGKGIIESDEVMELKAGESFGQPLTKEDCKKSGLFSDFIDTLDIDDFGSKKDD